MPVAHTCNPSYLGHLNQDCGLRPGQANSSRDPIFKITKAKCTEGMAQAVEHLPPNCEAMFKPQSQQKKKK
jgi:hypothetical protein